MVKSLIVPIHIEALFLPKKASVRESLADFTRLPYSDGEQDYNPDVAYLSEEILIPPFQDVNLVLPAGLHLHWYLPGVLTKTQSIGNKNAMPPVPDRWLITRFRNDTMDKNWLVESDVLTTDAVDNGLIRCHVPYYNGDPRSRNMPYRFLGRVTELNLRWRRDGPITGDRIENLTATGYEPQTGVTGYGEPTFAAFYPHCSSVFGFYDKDITLASTNITYQVLGFYARPQRDYFTQFIANFVRQPSHQSYNAQTFQDALYQAIRQEFNWEFDAAALLVPEALLQTFPSKGDGLPSVHSFYSARIECSRMPAKAAQPVYATAVGNTATEALSAFLADRIGGDKTAVENQLEAVALTARFNNRSLDTGAKFKEARHEKGFAAQPGETHWTVVLRSSAGGATDPDEDAAARMIVPAEDLRLLNNLQQQYEKAQLDLGTMQKHLYADWNKYMLCAYPPPDNQDAFPDIDEARTFIDTEHIAAITQAKQATGLLMVQNIEQGELLNAVATPAGPATIAGQLAAQMNKVLALVKTANDQAEPAKSNKKYTLKSLAGPRYWRPNDPVVLVAQTGKSTNGVRAGGRDPRAVLACVALNADLLNLDYLDAFSLLNLQKRISLLYQGHRKQLSALTWNGSPAQPFLLEWEVELFPAGTNGNLLTTDRKYTPDFISQHFQLGETETEFTSLETFNTTDEGENVYNGMSILTPSAGIKLGTDLEVYLAEWIKTNFSGQYYASANLPEANRNYTYLIENMDAFGNWAKQKVLGLTQLPQASDQNKNISAGLDAWWRANIPAFNTWYLSLLNGPADAVRNLMNSYRELQQWQCLAQSLGGFNDALLMRKQTRQLEVADPLGFPEYQDFTDRVREAVSGQSNSAPLPLNDFNPIRSGHMKILALRLVDNFGQTIDLAGLNQRCITSEPLRDTVHNDKVMLKPRLSQSARLNLRWLSAQHSDKETDTHPDTSPICGWLVPNYLDNSIAFYDEFGQALGSLTPNPDAPWQNAAGSAYAFAIGQIGNVHLQHVVTYLYNQQLQSLPLGGAANQESFLDQFLDVVESALEFVHPENSAQHTDIALLMGRPLAIVRVSLDLQLLGQPATHQGWDVFIKELQGAEAETDGFLQVEFPVRLGEHLQLNDGVIGYWTEDVDEQFGQTFYSHVASLVGHPNISTYKDGDPPLNVLINIDAPAQHYTVLMDPRGKLHATSGILPTKVIDIPPAHYTKALGNIETTFQVTPLLSDEGKTKISLPVEPGYNWSWIEQTSGKGWQEISASRMISVEVLREKIPDPDDLWDKLTLAGWLHPQADRSGMAVITPKDQRQPTDAGLHQGLLDIIDKVFDTYGQGLQPMDTTLTFGSKQVIREGWLKLSVEPVQTSK